MQVENVPLTRRAMHGTFDPRVEVPPSPRADFLAAGLTTPEAFLDLPGEIVSGHPDRHVMRVNLPDGRIAFLKKEHRVRWKDRFENWRAGFGWSSKSVREGRMLQRAASRNVGAPEWLAYGEDGRGRAFLLIAAVEDAIEARRFVHSPGVGEELAIALGRFCAELHAAAIDHPDLYLKHFLIDPATFAITLLDWQRVQMGEVHWRRRIQVLATLTATLPRQLTSPFVWAYHHETHARIRFGEAPSGRLGLIPSFASLTDALAKRVRVLERRRGIREQRQPPLAPSAQRLVWLDGEALCALPEVANDLRPESARRALYDLSRNQSEWTFSSGRNAHLRVGVSGGLFRGTAWRSPEVRLARLLFHLERYHIAAPKLLAYGQRRNGRRIEAFVLHESMPYDSQPLYEALFESNPFRCDWLLRNFAAVLARLHESGCEARTVECFSVIGDGTTIVVADATRLGFRRHLSVRRKSADCRRVIRSMRPYCGEEDLARFAEWLESESNR